MMKRSATILVLLLAMTAVGLAVIPAQATPASTCQFNYDTCMNYCREVGPPSPKCSGDCASEYNYCMGGGYGDEVIK